MLAFVTIGKVAPPSFEKNIVGPTENTMLFGFVGLTAIAGSLTKLITVSGAPVPGSMACRTAAVFSSLPGPDPTGGGEQDHAANTHATNAIDRLFPPMVNLPFV